MRAGLLEVMQLQSKWTRDNTPEMARRGLVIRRELPAELEKRRAELAGSLGLYGADLLFEGRDATGLKARVPWVRFASEAKAPSAQTGWYCVYLFRPDGDGVSLCLSHGSTRWNGGSMTARSDREAAQLISWAHAKLKTLVATNAAVKVGVDLGSKAKLARAYVKTTAYSISYSRSALPSEAELEADRRLFARLLAELYRQEDLGRAPGADAPEIEAACEAADGVARPLGKRKAGQGWGLTAAERQAVEAHAMRQAKSWLKANGYTAIKDVHRTRSCDFTAKKKGASHIVEVKGTTGNLGSILITRNELKLHRAEHPRNVLLVVHDVELDRVRLRASGGTISARTPWLIAADDLDPVCYACRVG